MQSGELENDSPSQMAGPTINGYVIEKRTRNFLCIFHDFTETNSENIQ